MSWLASIDMKDWLVVIATLLSPLIAVQVTKWLDQKNQVREEQIRIFKTLMATRAATLDPRHVESLNVIGVVFNSSEEKQKEIRRYWKEYLDHLNDKDYPVGPWGTKRVKLLVDLLHSMGSYLGFDLDKTHIGNEAYFPQGYSSLEDDQTAIRKAALEVLAGKRPLRMFVVNLPSQETQTGTDRNKNER
jgi:hypothetical protein